MLWKLIEPRPDWPFVISKEHQSLATHLNTAHVAFKYFYCVNLK